MNDKKYIRPVIKRTVSIPIPKFKLHSKVVNYKGDEVEIAARLYDVDFNVWRYKITGLEGLFSELDLALTYDYDEELKKRRSP